MQTFEKELIVPSKTVAGNITNFKQSYEIFYYPKTENYTDKIAFYIYLLSEEKKYAKRSIYFSNFEQLGELIQDLTKAYFYFRDKRLKPVIPLIDFRKLSLSSFLEHLSINQNKVWGKNDKNK